MKCLILAAGYATRLYPLTENFPKPLLEVGDKTILDWLIDDIDTSGDVDEYVVISNHKYAHHFENWAKTKSQKVTVVDDGKQGVIKIALKYGPNKSQIITGLRRVSKPGLRIYSNVEDMPKVMRGLGIAILSTSKGIMTDKQARRENVGGEVLAFIW